MLLLSLLVPTALAAPIPQFRPDFGAYHFDALDGCFASGLRLVVVEDHRQPVVSVTLVVDGGSAADPPGREGTAHLVEHLAFRALTGGGVPVMARLDQLGASVNGETYADVTTFVTLAPAANLAAVLAIEGQRLLDPLANVGPDDIEAERAITEDELRLHALDGAGVVWDTLLGALYPAGHPYHSAWANSASSIRAITADDLHAYARTWYRAARATLYITGDLAPAATRDLALDRLPDPVTGVPTGTPRVSCRSNLPNPPVVPPLPSVAKTVITANVRRPEVALGWSLPSAWGADDVVAELAVQAMDMLSSSKTCSRLPGRYASTAMCVGASLLPDPEVSSLAGIGKAARMLTDRYAYAEAATHLIFRVFHDAELSGHPFGENARAPALAAHLAGDPVHGGSVLEALARTDPRDVVAFAEHWLTPERASLVVATPAAEASDLPVTTVHTSPRPALDTPGGDVPAPAVVPDPTRIHRFVLPTGLQVVVLPYGDLPLVEVGLDFRGGRLLETEPGIAELLAAMEIYVPRNVGFDVEHAADALGAELTVLEDGLTAGRRYRAGAGNLDDLLYLLRLRLEGSEFDWQARGDFVESRARDLHARRANPDWWVRALSWDRLFHGHPLARGWLDDTRLLEIRKTPDAHVVAWRDRVRQPDNGTLYVVGHVDPVAAEATIRARFGTWKGRGKPAGTLPPLPPPPAPPPRQVLLLDVRDKALSTVSLACQLDGTATPEVLSITESLVRERITDAWRVRTAWSYDPQATVSHWEGGSALLQLSASLRHDVVGDAVRAAESLVATLATAAEGEADVRRHALSQARNLALTRYTVAGTLNWLASLSRDGWPAPVTVAPAPGAVAAEVTRVMTRCAGHEVIVVSGPAATLEDQLDRLGTPVEQIDWRRDAASRWKALDPDGWDRAR
jgi:zinc protease